MDSTASSNVRPSSRVRGDALQAEEAGVTLVAVEDLREGVDLLEGADAADAEEDLLLEAVLGVAAVETVGDVPADLGVLLDRRVEQVEGDAADLARQSLARRGVPARSTSTGSTSIGVRAMAWGSRVT